MSKAIVLAADLIDAVLNISQRAWGGLAGWESRWNAPLEVKSSSMAVAASPKSDSARSTASGRGIENHAMMRAMRSEGGLSLFTTCGGEVGSEPGTQSQSSLVLDHVRGGGAFEGSGPKHGIGKVAMLL